MTPISRDATHWRLILVGITTGILVAAVFVFATSGQSVTLPSFTVTTPAPVFPLETSVPRRLIIPKLNIDTHIQAVGVTANGTMDVAHSWTDVGWYQYGFLPGAPGNAVIEGHLDTLTSPQAIFYHLGTLVPGDEVDVVDASGTTLRFSVIATSSFPYDADTRSIFSSSTDSRLNLVTCDGTWLKDKHMYTARLVVFTKRKA